MAHDRSLRSAVPDGAPDRRDLRARLPRRRSQPASVDPAMLARGAREAGVDVGLTVDELRRALDAGHFVESRESEGNPNPRHVRAHAALVRAGVDTHTRWHAKTSRRAAHAVETFVERARELAQEAR